MYSHDLLLVISVVGMGLSVFQLLYVFVTWRDNESRDAKAILVMQEIYRRALKGKLQAVWSRSGRAGTNELQAVKEHQRLRPRLPRR